MRLPPSTPPSVPPAALLQGLEQAKEGFALTDAEGRFRYLNPEHLRIFGCTDPAELLGRPWTLLYEEREIEFIRREVFPVLSRERFWTGLLNARRITGETFHEDLTLSLLDDGGIVCNCRDRTREVALVEQTRRGERLLRAFLDHMPAAAAIRDSSGRVSYQNRRLEDLSDPQSPESAERHALQLADAEARIRAGENNATFDLPLPDGRVFASRVFAVRGENGQLEHTGEVALDVTEERRWEAASLRTLEHQAKLLEQHRGFVALVSHEFRTPLAALSGSLYLLRRSLAQEPNPKVAHYLDIQSSALAGLAELVDRVTLLERINERSPSDCTTPVDLRALVESVVQTRPELADGTRLELRLPDAPCIVKADETLLRAAIDNLLSNALKYSAQGSPIAVSLSCTGPAASIEVADRGIGVPAADQPRLFEAFFRARNTIQQPGVGLGLHLVRRVAEKHGGRSDFTSVENNGSSFRLQLPLAAS